jgi:hypothetical protein
MLQVQEEHSNQDGQHQVGFAKELVCILTCFYSMEDLLQATNCRAEDPD